VYRWPVKDDETARTHLPVLDQVASQLFALGWGCRFRRSHCTDQPMDLRRPRNWSISHLEHGGKRASDSRGWVLVHLGDCHQRSLTASLRRHQPYTRPTRFGQSRYVARDLPALAGQSCLSSRRWTAILSQPGGTKRKPLLLAAPCGGRALRQEEMSQEWIDSYCWAILLQKNLGKALFPPASFHWLQAYRRRNSPGHDR